MLQDVADSRFKIEGERAIETKEIETGDDLETGREILSHDESIVEEEYKRTCRPYTYEHQ
jgi:hypothetical protein